LIVRSLDTLAGCGCAKPAPQERSAHGNIKGIADNLEVTREDLGPNLCADSEAELTAVVTQRASRQVLMERRKLLCR